MPTRLDHGSLVLLADEQLQIHNAAGTTLWLPWQHVPELLAVLDDPDEHWIGSEHSPFVVDGPEAHGVWLPAERSGRERALIPFGSWRRGWATALEASIADWRRLLSQMLAAHGPLPASSHRGTLADALSATRAPSR